MAVYTEVSDDALAAFLADYDIGGLIAFRGIAEGVENSNYSLRTAAGDYILTLYEKRVDPADLPWFLGLMEHLARRGIVCPLPVPGRDGRSLAGALRPARGDHHFSARRVAPAGAARALRARRRRARLPAPRRDGLRADAAQRPRSGGWPPLLEQSRPRADEVQAGLADELEAALDSILGAWPVGLPVGHIHADLFPDNVFFLDGPGFGADRLLLRRDRHSRLRHRGLHQRLVLRARHFAQRNQGARHARRL